MGVLRLLSSPVKAAATCVVLILVLGAASASAEEPACGSSSLYVAAHQDDTLLFQSPYLLQDIQSEHCVRTVFTTAGDAGRAQSYWSMREAGAEDAYAQMAGVANQWTDSVVTVNGHPVHLKTLKAKPTISIAYLRLPDGGTNGLGFPLYGNQSLMKLWNSEHQNEEDNLPEITSIKANDNSATYGYSDLIATLKALMTSFGPQQVYTQNYTANLISADHPDHVVTGLFVREASRGYSAAHRLVGFQDYETVGRPQNVTGTLLGSKSAAFYKYGAHDSDACASEGACTGSEYAQWLLRQYMVSSTKFETTGVVANAGFTQLTEPSTVVTLDGSGSSVETGKTAQYNWTQIGGPAVTLTSLVASKPTFATPSHPTNLTFSLVVKDGTNTSRADTVVIKAPSSDPTPTAIAGPPQTVASGSKVTLNGSESWDPNSATLQYSWLQTSGPAVTVTGGSTATPSFTAPTGPTSVKFSLMVSNGSQTSAPSTVTITVNGVVPSFSSATSAPFTTGVAGSFKVTTIASPTAALSRTEGELPLGLSFTDNGDGSATIAGTPSAAAAPVGATQSYPIKLKATNSEGSTPQTLTLNVTNPGTAPAFTSGTSTTFTTGVAGTFTVAASGEPLPTVTKTAGTLPPGVGVTTNANGTLTISGTPTAAAAEPGESRGYPLTFKAQNAAGAPSQSFTLTVVNPGTAPAFTSATSTGFTVGSAKTFVVSTSGTPAAAIAKTSGSLPPGLTLTDQGDGTAKLSGTATGAAAPAGGSQEYTVGLKAENSAGSDTQTLTITVTNPGTAPSFTSAASTTFTVGAAKTFTVQTTSNPIAALTRTGTLPPGIAFKDNGDGTATLSGTATNAAAPPADSQAYPLSFEATALSGSKAQSFALTVVNPGTAPSFTSAASTGFTTGVAGSFKVTTTGVPAAALSLTGSGELPAGVIMVDNGDGSATISGTAPTSAAPPSSSKNYSVTIQAQSGAGKQTQSFTLTVTNPGNAPAITSAAATGFTAGVAGSFEITSTGTPAAILTRTGELPAGVVFSDQGSGKATISGTPSASAAPPASSKNYPLTIKAANGAGTITQAFTLTVSNPGTGPKITSLSSASFTTGAPGSFKVSSSGDPNATLSRTGTLPSGLTFVNNGDGTATIAGTPAGSAAPPASSQAYPLAIRALNGAGEDTQTLTLTVVNPGVAPTFTSGTSASFTTGAAGSFAITTSGSPTAALSWIEGELPDGLSFTPNGNGTATIAGTAVASTAPAAGSKPYPLTIKASSGAGSKTQALTLTVTNPGVKPAITSGTSAAFTTGTAGSFKVVATGDPIPALAETGELPSGLSFTDTDNGNATIAGTPAASAAPAGSSQDYPLTIKATNGAGSASQKLTLTVSNPGTGPSITSAAATSFTTGVEASFEVTSIGAPTATVSREAGELPPGVSFSAEGNGRATISGTPTAAAATPGTGRDYPLILKAQSSVGSVKQNFTLTVLNPGAGPAFTSAPSASFTTGAPGSFTVGSTGSPTPVLSRVAGALPNGLSFTVNGDGTATIAGTAASSAAPPGMSQDYPLTLRASSSIGNVSQSFTLTVVNPSQPVVTPPVGEQRQIVDPPKSSDPGSPAAVEPVRVTLSRTKVLLPVGRYARRVVRVTAPADASVACHGKLPKGARCRIGAPRRVVIEASKALRRAGTFALSIQVTDGDARVRRRLIVQMLAADDPALRRGR